MTPKDYNHKTWTCAKQLAISDANHLPPLTIVNGKPEKRILAVFTQGEITTSGQSDIGIDGYFLRIWRQLFK
jgi:hypothetical protein